MAELLLLGVASAFWPTLLAIVILSVRAPHPGRLMASFLAAGLLTTVVVGLSVIYALQESPGTSGAKHSFGPLAQIVVGSLAVLAALALHYRHSRRPPEVDAEAPQPEVDAEAPQPEVDAAAPRPGWIERMLARGAALAFVAGVVLNIVPGFFPVIALKDIAEMEKSVAETTVIVIGFYLIMFAFIEIPLLGYVFAPARTAREAQRFNTWLDRNAHRLAVGALGIAGTYLIVRGITLLAD